MYMYRTSLVISKLVKWSYIILIEMCYQIQNQLSEVKYLMLNSLFNHAHIAMHTESNKKHEQMVIFSRLHVWLATYNLEGRLWISITILQRGRQRWWKQNRASAWEWIFCKFLTVKVDATRMTDLLLYSCFVKVYQKHHSKFKALDLIVHTRSSK